MSDENVISEQLGLSLEDNYLRLAAELYKDRHFAEEPTRDDRIRSAVTWLKSLSERMKPAICRDSRVKSFLRDQDSSRRVLLVAAIADMLSSSVFPASPWTVAVLLVQEGLHNLCPEVIERTPTGPGEQRH